MNKPKIEKRLFWEYDYDNIDWQNEAVGIIQRVIERGTHEEWGVLTDYYSRGKVISTLKNDITYLPQEVVTDVCTYFQLSPNDLKCCSKDSWRGGYWP